jgi:secreted trypsin-like serine protease
MFKKFLSSLAAVSLCLAIFPTSVFAIENGADASGNEFTVFIVTSWNSKSISTCSGALLNDYVVVTAAHCINDESGLISKKIRVSPPGSTNEFNSEGVLIAKANWVEVDSTQVTVTYQSGSTKVTDDDLAFLTLLTPMKSNAQIRIASEDEMLKLRTANAPLKIYGYGYVTDDGKNATSPNYLNATFDSTPHRLTNSAYAKSSNANLCAGDSGGPVVNITPTQITVVGVATGVTYSNKCSKKHSDGNYYSTFTLLNRYANLAFATTSRIAANLNAATISKSELESSNARIIELEAEVEKWAGDYTDLELEIDALKSEIEYLKAKLPKTINCIKGTSTKKVTAVNAKCPAGYKLKS